MARKITSLILLTIVLTLTTAQVIGPHNPAYHSGYELGHKVGLPVQAVLNRPAPPPPVGAEAPVAAPVVAAP